MTSLTQPNTAAIDPSSHKQFLEDGEQFNEDTIEQMSTAIKNSENLDQFLHHINAQKNRSQANEDLATSTGSPNKLGLSVYTRGQPGSVNYRFFDPFQYLNSSDEEECTFHPQINRNAGKLAKREFNGDTNEMLYKYSYERSLKKQEYFNYTHQEAASKAYINKSDNKSIRMILKKLQVAISNLVSGAEDEGQEGVLTFEALGTVLHRLGIFQNLEFVANKDGEKSSLSINYARVKPERLAKEIAFHENFWKIAALTSLNNETVSSEFVAKLLTVLVESKTAVAEAGSFLTDIVNAQLATVGAKGEEEKTAFDLQREEKELWSLSKVVTEFRQLFDNKTHFMAIYNAKAEKVLDNERNANFTHTPEVNKKSHKIDKRHWGPKFQSRLEKGKPDLAEHELKTRNNRLHVYHKYIQNKKNARLEERIAEELHPCTFVPKIKPYKKNQPLSGHSRVNETYNESLSPSRLGYFTQALADNTSANRHLLLYEVHKTYKEKLQQKTYAHKKKEEAHEMSECKFHPQINNDSHASTIRQSDFYEGVPRGFKKNVERLHLGGYLKETSKAELEKIPRGENYHKNKAAEFTPPTFLERPKIKKDEVLVYVDVSIGPGKTGRIGIHKGDNAKDLAKNFSRTYSLNATMKESLEKLLQSYIDSYFSQPADTQEAENEVEEDAEEGSQEANEEEEVNEGEEDAEEEDGEDDN